MRDEIIEELRGIREEYAKRFDYDVKAIFKDAKRREAESAWPRSAPSDPKQEIA